MILPRIFKECTNSVFKTLFHFASSDPVLHS